MGILTVLRFLIGQRQAILDIAASRHAIWLGLLFVLSAGFAREYDGEDLLHEPWHLMLPLVASLATSTILFALLWLTLHGWRTMPNEWRTYQSFVSLYWMTAPLAWIYAIPVERMFDAGRATEANLWFLGIVAVWRIVLMIRVVSVIFQAPVVRVVFPFMLFADGVLLALLSIVPVPILAVMGGVRLSQSEQIMAGVTFLATALGMVSLPIWGLGTLIALFAPRHVERVASFASMPEKPIRASLWSLAGAALIVWGIVLPFTQPEQQRRWEVEQLMAQHQIAAALQAMSKYEKEDFPPHWDPPPRIAELRGPRRWPPEVRIIKLMHELDQLPAVDAWVRASYEKKFEDHFEWNWHGSRFWISLSDQDLELYLTWFERHPPSDEFIADQHRVLRYSSEEFEKRSPAQWLRLRTIFRVEEEPQTATEQPTTSIPPNPVEEPQTPSTAGSAGDKNAVGAPASTAEDR